MFLEQLLEVLARVLAALVRVMRKRGAVKGVSAPRSQSSGGTLTITREQFDALVLGLPWQRSGEAGIIRVL
jgi:hypothetical protein